MTCSWGRRPARRALLGALALVLTASMAAVLPTTAGAASAPAPAAAAMEPRPTDHQLKNDMAPTPKYCGKPPWHGCRLAWYGAQAPTLVVWGDSHMWMMTPAVVAALNGARVNVVLYHAGGCIPAQPDMTIYAGNACAELSVETMDYLLKLRDSGRPFRLLLGSFWGANLNRVFWYENQERADIMRDRRKYTLKYTRPLFRWLGNQGIPTDVSGQGPISVPPSDCGRGTWPFWCSVPRGRAMYKQGYVGGWLATQMRQLPKGAHLIDYAEGICGKKACPAVVKGVHTWFDPYHISATKAASLERFYVPTIQRTLRAR